MWAVCKHPPILQREYGQSHVLVSAAAAGARSQYSTENQDNYINVVTYRKQTLEFGAWMSPKAQLLQAQPLTHDRQHWEYRALGSREQGKKVRLLNHCLAEDLRPGLIPPLPPFFVGFVSLVCSQPPWAKLLLLLYTPYYDALPPLKPQSNLVNQPWTKTSKAMSQTDLSSF